MLTGIDNKETIEYVSKYDPNPGNPTVFLLGVVDALTMGRIEDNLTVFSIDPKNPEAKTDTKLATGKREVELLRAGLKGWKNFRDPQGNEIKFDITTSRTSGMAVDVATNETLKWIPTLVFKELANVIYNQNKLTETEEKNSE